MQRNSHKILAGTFSKLCVVRNSQIFAYLSARYTSKSELALDHDDKTLVSSFGNMWPVYMFGTIHVGYLFDTRMADTKVSRMSVVLRRGLKRDATSGVVRPVSIDRNVKLLHTEMLTIVESELNESVLLTPVVDPVIKEIQ